GRAMDAAAGENLAASRVAESGAAAALGVHAVDADHAGTGGGSDVPADAGWPRSGDQGLALTLLLLQGLDVGQHHLRVALRVDVGVVLDDLALGIDQERVALRQLHRAEIGL